MLAREDFLPREDPVLNVVMSQTPSIGHGGVAPKFSSTTLIDAILLGASSLMFSSRKYAYLPIKRTLFVIYVNLNHAYLFLRDLNHTYSFER